MLSHRSASPTARMAHDRLLSPLPIVMQLFGPVEALGLPEGSEAKRQLEELDNGRLNIGPLDTPGGCMFTVYKAPTQNSKRGESVRRRSFQTRNAPSEPTYPPLPRLEFNPSSGSGSVTCASETEFGDDDDGASITTFDPSITEPDAARQRNLHWSGFSFSSRSTLVQHLASEFLP